MDDIEVLVSSCDKYSGAWPACCHGLKKYWPDRIWPLTFMSNYKKPPCGRVCKVGRDISWSDNLLLALERIKAQVVLFMTEDIWLTESVDVRKLREYARILARNKAGHIRLFPPRKVFSADNFDTLYTFSDKEPYRVSTHAGLWRVDVVRRLLKSGESIWEFELKGSHRSQDETMMCVKKFNAFQYVNRNYGGWNDEPVWRGRWTNAAFKYAKREGLEIDFSRQPKDG